MPRTAVGESPTHAREVCPVVGPPTTSDLEADVHRPEPRRHPCEQGPAHFARSRAYPVYPWSPPIHDFPGETLNPIG
jgi:hypothetical protein